MIYAPHNIINGNRTLYKQGESRFDHFPYKTFVTNEAKVYPEHQVKTPSQVATGKSGVPEFAIHDVIYDNKFVIINRNRRNQRCIALVAPEDIHFVSPEE